MPNIVDILNEGAGSILGFIVALVPLIALHEMGHMFMAKAVGVWVREFGIGFPPRITKLFKWQETVFTLNWLPLGGFARMEGEMTMIEGDGEADETEEEGPEDEEARRHSLDAQPPGKRILIFLAGPGMNFLTGWFLAILLFLTGFPVVDEMRVAITEVADNSPAAQAGLQAGDYIESINGQPIEEITEISQITDENLGESMTITVSRDGEMETVSLVPRADPPEGEGAMGVIITADPRYHVETLSLPRAVVRGTGTFFALVGQILMLPITIIRGLIPLEMARPAGIITTSRLAYASIQQSITQGTLIPILDLLIVVNVSLAIFNLLPIPILDGGHVLFTLIELIKGEPIKPSLKERIYQVALIFLALLFVATIALDLLFPVL